jgi:hypothetical protein
VMLFKWWSTIQIFSQIWQCSKYEGREILSTFSCCICSCVEYLQIHLFFDKLFCQKTKKIDRIFFRVLNTTLMIILKNCIDAWWGFDAIFSTHPTLVDVLGFFLFVSKLAHMNAQGYYFGYKCDQCYYLFVFLSNHGNVHNW